MNDDKHNIAMGTGMVAAPAASGENFPGPMSCCARMKNIPLNERSHFEFRADFFNLFNHTQFYNPDGNSTDGSQFGQVIQVKDPRLAQFALKFYF